MAITTPWKGVSRKGPVSSSLTSSALYYYSARQQTFFRLLVTPFVLRLRSGQVDQGLQKVHCPAYKTMEEQTKQLDLSNKVYKLVVAIIILVALFYAGNLYQSFQTLPQNYPQEISVSGQGKIYAKPDVAVLVLGSKDSGFKVSDAVKINTEKMNKIIEDIKDLGVKEEDIQTTQYSIEPNYNWTESRGRIFEGYNVTQQITVKVRDFDKIGSILDKATSGGANEVGNLQFTIDNPEKVQAEAKTKAIEQAKDKAKVLAKQAGLKLVKIVNISDGYQPSPMSSYKGGGVMMESSVAAAPDIQSGQMEINSSIILTYRVK